MGIIFSVKIVPVRFQWITLQIWHYKSRQEDTRNANEGNTLLKLSLQILRECFKEQRMDTNLLSS